MTEPVAPAPIQVGLRGTEQGFSLEAGDVQFSFPWAALIPVIQGFLNLASQRGMNLAALIRLLTEQLQSGTPQSEYRLCKRDGARWSPVLDDGHTFDPDEQKPALWRPGTTEPRGGGIFREHA